MRIVYSILVFLLSMNVYSAPKSDLWDVWTGFDSQNKQTIDHKPLDEFLSKYSTLDDKGNRLINYAGVANQDNQNLKNYVSFLQSKNPLLFSREEQFAYWVNLYNALTIVLILENYPIKSITKLGGFFSFGPWDDDIAEVNGVKITLNDIEHRILRPIWKDNRIHYVVNCASIGCPNIGDKSFSSSDIDGQLNQAAKQFINSKKGVAVIDGSLRLSSIYDWYAVDFGDKTQLFNHLSKYLNSTNPARTLVEGKRVDVDYDYDWALNNYRK